MIAVIQRVYNAEVSADGMKESIGAGLLLFLGVAKTDQEKDADILAEKICQLRIFEDENNKMNLQMSEVSGELMVISNFTLCADCSHGRRPNFEKAERPDRARYLYEYFISMCERILNNKVKTGIFGADMKVNITNDGPVTIVLDSEKLKG